MPITNANSDRVMVGPAASENPWTPVADIDVSVWRSLAFSIWVKDAAVDWRIYGAHEADFSDEFKLTETETIQPDEGDTKTFAVLACQYYRAKVKSTLPNTPGMYKVVATAKA